VHSAGGPQRARPPEDRAGGLFRARAGAGAMPCLAAAALQPRQLERQRWSRRQRCAALPTPRRRTEDLLPGAPGLAGCQGAGMQPPTPPPALTPGSPPTPSALQALGLSGVQPGGEIDALLEVVAKVFEAPTAALAFFLTGALPRVAASPASRRAWALGMGMGPAGPLAVAWRSCAARGHAGPAGPLCPGKGGAPRRSAIISPLQISRCTACAAAGPPSACRGPGRADAPAAAPTAGKGAITNTYQNQPGDVTWNNATCMWALLKANPSVLVVEDMQQDKRWGGGWAGAAQGCWSVWGEEGHAAAAGRGEGTRGCSRCCLMLRRLLRRASPTPGFSGSAGVQRVEGGSARSPMHVGICCRRSPAGAGAGRQSGARAGIPAAAWPWL
jgi:hypothetical protein